MDLFSAVAEKDVTFRVARRLKDVVKDVNRLKVTIGTDYSNFTSEMTYD